MAKKQAIHIILLLILAGETIFILPFVLVRIFRPTYLDLFDLTNFELGTCFSIYGIVALFSYFWGGPLADRFKPRLLISAALVLTSIGGLVLATYPNLLTLKILYGYWGFTTIFLFWGAMIKATRIWGGKTMQGRAFGFLDGGRGLVAAVIGSLGILIFSSFTNIELDSTNFEERQQAFRYVILSISLLISLIAILVYIFLKPEYLAEDNEPVYVRITLSNFKEAMKFPSVWWLMIIILCAYVGYKITDIFSLYAKEVMLYNEIEAAKTGTFLLYIRPVVGISIGFLADRTKSASVILWGFICMFLGAIIYSTGIVEAGMHGLFFITLFATALGTYTLRSLYFAVIQESRIPLAITGTTVGLVSVIGYTPDIFVGPIMGFLLDNSPGKAGHQNVFILLAVFSLIGLVSAFFLNKEVKKPSLKS